MSQTKSILLSIASVLIMIALYAGTQGGWFGENPVGRTGNYNEPLIVPQPYAFSIWGLIYLFLIILPIFHWFKRRESNLEWNSFRAWFSINVILNGVWLVAASYDWLWISVAIIVVMLISLYMMRVKLSKLKLAGEPVHYWMEEFVVHIYFAWITLATVLNISAAFTFYGWNGFGQTEVFWSLAILLITAIIATAVFYRFKDRAFAGVVVWAFIAIIVKHITANPSIAYLSIVVAGVFSIFMVFPKKRLPSLSTKS